jgi:hypothetical protein
VLDVFEDEAPEEAAPAAAPAPQAPLRKRLDEAAEAAGLNSRPLLHFAPGSDVRAAAPAAAAAHVAHAAAATPLTADALRWCAPNLPPKCACRANGVPMLTLSALRRMGDALASARAAHAETCVEEMRAAAWAAYALRTRPASPPPAPVAPAAEPAAEPAPVAVEAVSQALAELPLPADELMDAAPEPAPAAPEPLLEPVAAEPVPMPPAAEPEATAEPDVLPMQEPPAAVRAAACAAAMRAHRMAHAALPRSQACVAVLEDPEPCEPAAPSPSPPGAHRLRCKTPSAHRR